MNKTYHNHTTWSDGRLSPDELVEKAISLGFDEVGITDHYFTLKAMNESVKDEKIDEYIAMINELRNKYQGRTRILSGLEVDVSSLSPRRFSLPVEKFNNLDYILIENLGREYHFDDLPEFKLSDLIDLKDRLSCKVGLAHPDLKMLIEKFGAEELVKILAENKIFIDACGSKRNSVCSEHPRGYTLNIEGLPEDFYQAARKYELKFLPSSDTHWNLEGFDSLIETRNATEAISANELGFLEL